MHAFGGSNNLLQPSRKLAKLAFLTFVTLAVLITLPCLCGCSEEKELPVEEVSVPFEASGILSSFGKISYKQQIEIQGEEYLLYPTFDDPSEALEKLKEDCTRTLELLRSGYFLGNLDQNNWKNYMDAMYKELDSANCPDWYGEQSDEFCEMRSFFDMYENEDKNAELLETARKHGVDAILYDLPSL